MGRDPYDLDGKRELDFLKLAQEEAEAHAEAHPVFAEAARLAREPLTADDEAAIRTVLTTWLSHRNNVRCASCEGTGQVTCEACGGTGVEDMVRGPCPPACTRGKLPCERKTCTKGRDLRALERVVLDARARHRRATLRVLLGGGPDWAVRFVEVLGVLLADSPEAPEVVAKAAADLGVGELLLLDALGAYGVGAELVAPFASHTAASAVVAARSVVYAVTATEGGEHMERAWFEKVDGVWYLERVELEDTGSQR